MDRVGEGNEVLRTGGRNPAPGPALTKREAAPDREGAVPGGAPEAAGLLRSPARLLILGGTREAVELACAFAGNPGVETTYSLAGRTRRPASVPVPVRTGGFGGPDGLAAYLRDEKIELVVDATHPYAATMSAHAALACDRAAVPRLVLHRPSWTPELRDRWVDVPDAERAARALPALGKRALLTVGSRELAPYIEEKAVAFVVRAVEPPSISLDPARFEVVLARGPFDFESECRLLESRAIDVVVSKNSGGTAAHAKLDAARALGLPVVMIARPPPPPGERVESVEAAVAWTEAHVARTTSTRAGSSAGAR